jgi:hypothetical protein
MILGTAHSATGLVLHEAAKLFPSGWSVSIRLYRLKKTSTKLPSHFTIDGIFLELSAVPTENIFV